MARWHRTFGLFPATLTLCLFTAAGCHQGPPPSQEGRQNIQQEATVALNEFKQADPSLDEFLRRAYGYALFPSVGKGGFIVGGAHGKGVVYEQGRMVGFADLNQASVGFLAGGQTFRELIVFATKEALDKFRNGQYSLGADVNVVALTTGAGAGAQFKNGVAVFVKPTGGAMFDVSVAGQKFNYSGAPAESKP